MPRNDPASPPVSSVTCMGKERLCRTMRRMTRSLCIFMALAIGYLRCIDGYVSNGGGRILAGRGLLRRQTLVGAASSDPGKIEKKPISEMELIAERARQAVRNMDVKEFLVTILSFRYVEEQKQPCFARLRELRSQPVELNSVLDEILDELDSVERMFFPNLRYPFPLPSYRVKLAATRRLVESIVQAESSDGDPEGRRKDQGGRKEAAAAAVTTTTTSSPTASLRNEGAPSPEALDARVRRRRALLIVLGQLENHRGVRRLEAYARKSRAASASIEEMIKRTPSGLETPMYEVIERQSNWEIRRYRDFSVCSMVMNINSNSTSTTSSGGDSSAKGQAMAGGGAFNALAGYIFGRNEKEERMSMTTPVITTPTLGGHNSQDTKMSFVMPSRFWGKDLLPEAPRPMSESAVVLEMGGAGIATAETVAVLWFGGYATRAEVDRRTKELRALIKAYPAWRAAGAEAQPFLLQYNDPFQPPWSRRNEIVIPVRPVYHSVESSGDAG